MSAEDPQGEAAVEPKSAEPDYYAQLLKLKAEFENYRKRIDRERPEWVKLGSAGLLVRLLPLYDVLLKAHVEITRLGGDGSGQNKELVHGLEMVFKEFSKIFEAEGIEPIESLGQPYDHDRHEVLGSVESDEPEGTVMEELQPGYTLHGKVLRPAKVRIAKVPSPPAGDEAVGGQSDV